MKKYIKIIVLVVAIVSVLICGIVGAYLIHKRANPRKPVVGGYAGIYTGTYTSTRERPDFSYTEPFTTVEQNGLTVSAKLGSKMVSIDGKSYVLITLEGEELVLNSDTKRPPLNLGIVIDRSGSMSGQKLDFVKEALMEVSSMLLPQDIVTLVTYDDYVDVVYQSKEFNRDDFLSEVERITAGGSTNLEGGLREGIDSVSELLGEDSINKVILLSDGLANVGVSDSDTLSSMVSDLVDNDIVISTIGVGVDYDDVLMSSVAIAGNGSYYFLEDPSHAQDIFATELQSSMTTIAKNISVIFNTEDEFKVISGIGYELDSTAGFEPNNIYAGKSSRYLFEVDSLTHRRGETLMMSLDVSFDNVETGNRETMILPMYVELTNDDTDPLLDDEVYYEYVDGQLGFKLWSVYEDLNNNDNEDAEKEISSVIDLLKEANSRLDGVFDEDIDSLEDKQVYIEGLDDTYINDTSDGRLFQKSNQSISYEKVYNK